MEAAAGDGREVGCVLIVDDDDVVRLVCAVNLEAEGVRVLEASDGLEGLEQARSQRPDLVLTDVSMPGLDGFELAAQLRRDVHTRRIPVVFLSGEAAKPNADRARALGAVAYLTKPFDPIALAAFVVRELAAARAGTPELAAELAN
jgi:two-component system alkaline phosphatase synthesis response regulator PhoP